MPLVPSIPAGGCCFFFFSSRRRHTRLVSDWSSDVCSSDLAESLEAIVNGMHPQPVVQCLAGGRAVDTCIGASLKVPTDRRRGAIRTVEISNGRSEERRVGKEGRTRGRAEQ